MTAVYLGVGTNLGDRLTNLSQAKAALERRVKLLNESSLYETQPWGYTDQPSFLNQVLLIETRMGPRCLLRFLKRIEKRLGREKTIRYGPRLIDLDILFYGDRVLNTKKLQIPHPRIPERAFVLVPMAEIAPDRIHPVLNKTMQQLLDELPDKSGVAKCG